MRSDRRPTEPRIAAVAGYALGGGCELAMICDSIIAAGDAKFGQPEIKLGVMPGIGGAQRLARAIGTAKTMDLCFMGRMTAEAERSGLISRVVTPDRLMEESLGVAEAIACISAPVSTMTRETVERALEFSLAEGVGFERRMVHSCFAAADQNEEMTAFRENGAAQFRHA
jgi:enoyl-CoA hydratase